MSANTTPKIIVTLFAVFFISFLFAQRGYEGELLVSFLGKSAESQEMKDLENSYNCQMANENHYLSKAGIELLLEQGVLNEIHLYKESSVYGNFSGKMPGGIIFGQSSAEVKKRLGKPSVNYASGYCEFELQNHVISCWFEKDRLTQVDLSLK